MHKTKHPCGNRDSEPFVISVLGMARPLHSSFVGAPRPAPASLRSFCLTGLSSPHENAGRRRGTFPTWRSPNPRAPPPARSEGHVEISGILPESRRSPQRVRDPIRQNKAKQDQTPFPVGRGGFGAMNSLDRQAAKYLEPRMHQNGHAAS